MDDDIVTRLRNGTPTAVYVIANDAADEIERLRAEIERLRAAGDRLSAAVNAVSCSGPRDEMVELTDAFLDWEARRG